VGGVKIDGKQVDALAAGIFTRVTGFPWSQATKDNRAFYRSVARAALEDLVADGWSRESRLEATA
jgi:hypothetical protein